MRILHLFAATSLLALTLLSAGCGSSSSSFAPPPATSNPPPPPTTQKGIEGGGIVTGLEASFSTLKTGGVTYDISNAAVSIDGAPATAMDLRVGNVVSVVATTTDEGITAVASTVMVSNELEGPITAGSINIAASTFVVLGQTVRVTATTVFEDDFADRSINGLSDGQFVEVSGLPDASGVLVASRIEDENDGEYEIEGLVSGHDPATMTFAINQANVDYSAASLSGFTSGMPADGDRVEVRGTQLAQDGTLLAAQVEREDRSGFRGGAGDLVSLEGYVTRFVSATDFDVSGRPVTTTSTTFYDDGSVADLALNVRVEIDGSLDANGVLVALRVDFENELDAADADIEIEALIDSVDQTAGTFTVLGLVIAVDGSTVFEDQSGGSGGSFSLATLMQGNYVEVEAVPVSGMLRALGVERDEDEGDVQMRGLVESVAEPAFTLSGVAIATVPGTRFENAADQPISAGEFFAALAVGGVAKAKGSWDGATLTAAEAELEND